MRNILRQRGLRTTKDCIRTLNNQLQWEVELSTVFSSEYYWASIRKEAVANSVL